MRPKILFLCTAAPFGTISGAGVRTRNVGRLLQKIGSVTMVAATEREWTADQVDQTREAFEVAGILRYRQSPIRTVNDRMRKILDPRFLNTNGVELSPHDNALVQQLIDSHDVVWIHTLKVANAFRRFHWAKSVMDVDDFPSRFHETAARFAPSGIMKLKRWQKTFSWRRSESLSLKRFTIVTVCKESDRSYFGNESRVLVIPNGFDAPAHNVRRIDLMSPRLGMIGDFGYLPNHDGLKWFLDNAWPQVKRAVPSAELRLVGKSSAEIAQASHAPATTGLGYVGDVAAEMSTWSAMIVPTRLGGGTHLKLAEGLARNVPIVTTQHGARGYQVVHGKHVLMAETSDDFAESCARLLTNEHEGKRLNKAGWDLFTEKYSWDSIAPSVAVAVQSCMSMSNKAVQAASV